MKTTNLNQLSRMLVLSVIVLFSIPFLSNASGIITGHVIDCKNQPVESATATLINPETNQIVVGDMCDKNGEYILEDVEPGSYILRVRNVGYEKNESVMVVNYPDITIVKENPIVLNECIEELDELEVVSKKLTTKQPIEEITDYSNTTSDIASNNF